jgi:hypothetical protein
MNSRNSISFKISVLSIFMILFSGFYSHSQSQDLKYYPKGYPKKWNVELTPFFYLPWISGDITSKYISVNYEVPAIDLIKNLKMAFMINAEVSRGKFFVSPTYIYVKVGSEEVLRTDREGFDALVKVQEIKMNIAEVIAGARLPAGKKVLFDPFIGFRYNNIKSSVEADGKLDTITVSETIEFWDPVIGVRLNYFPHPRVPLSLRGDIGGFGAGSKLSWTAALKGGYSVSPLIDLIAGFTAYGFDYETETGNGRPVGLKTIFYGFNFGVTFHIPKRYKDPVIFKKFTEK